MAEEKDERKGVDGNPDRDRPSRRAGSEPSRGNDRGSYLRTPPSGDRGARPSAGRGAQSPDDPGRRARSSAGDRRDDGYRGAGRRTPTGSSDRGYSRSNDGPHGARSDSSERRGYGRQDSGERQAQRGSGSADRRGYGQARSGERGGYNRPDRSDTRGYQGSDARRGNSGAHRGQGESASGERRGYGRSDSGERRGYRGQDSGAGRPQRGGKDRVRSDGRPRIPDPFLPDEITAADLHPSARNELKTLSKENAERVARHLAMAARLVDDDPVAAHEHARAASRHAARIAIVRESVAITAYAVGDFALALRELRTYRRISGKDDQIALIVDSERGVGRPDRALEEGRAVDRAALPTAERVALAIAMSGARLDRGETELALGELEIPELDPDRAFEWSPALFSARAAVLEDLGREEEAAFWNSRASVAAAALGLDDDEIIVEDGLVEDGLINEGLVDEADRSHEDSADESDKDSGPTGEAVSPIDESVATTADDAAADDAAATGDVPGTNDAAVSPDDSAAAMAGEDA